MHQITKKAACDIMTPMLRRSFLALSAAAPFSAVAQSRFAVARTVAEWSFTASRPHA
jgi:gamma-glutamyl:cysteine ligase YbdK (ATP-grasp superfamily)